MSGFRSRSNDKRAGGSAKFTHRWIKSPNTARQLCTACGMRREVTWNKELKRNETTYISKDGIISKEYQPCTIESYGDII